MKINFIANKKIAVNNQSGSSTKLLLTIIIIKCENSLKKCMLFNQTRFTTTTDKTNFARACTILSIL